MPLVTQTIHHLLAVLVYTGPTSGRFPQYFPVWSGRGLAPICSDSQTHRFGHGASVQATLPLEPAQVIFR